MNQASAPGNGNIFYLENQMRIEYEGICEGHRLFNVKRGDGKCLFTGTLDQCRRFIEVYREKVLKQTG